MFSSQKKHLLLKGNFKLSTSEQLKFTIVKQSSRILRQDKIHLLPENGKLRQIAKQLLDSQRKLRAIDVNRCFVSSHEKCFKCVLETGYTFIKEMAVITF